jgi:hypothetical protein
MGARELVRQWALRALLLSLWSLVAWGALLLLTALVNAVGEGLLPSLARLLPARGASVWAWLNGLSVALALSVGVLAGGYVAWTRRGRRRPPTP